jgi:exonuclease SbcC
MQRPERSLEQRQADGSWTVLVSDNREKFFQPVFDAVLEGFTPHDFNRSMLLAQGQFDALLRASAAERAEILERLTDTSIYKELGSRAATIRSAWQKRLDVVTHRLEALPPLDTDKVAAIREREEQLKAEDATLANRLEELRERQRWLEEAERRAQQVAERQAKLDAASEALAARAPLAASVAAHEAAEPAFPMLDEWRRAERETASLRERIDRIEAERPERASAAEEADRELAEATTARDRSRTILERLEPLLDAATDAKRNRAAAEAAHNRTTSVHATAESRARAKVDAAQLAIARFNEARGAFRADVRNGPADVGESSSPWQERVATAVAVVVSEASPEAHIGGDPTDARAVHVPSPEVFVAASDVLQTLVDACDTTRTALTAANEAEKGIRSAGDVRARADAHLERCRREQSDAQSELRVTQAAVTTAEQEVEKAKATLEPLARLMSRAHERRALIAGEPCPVCGSTEHPLVDDDAESSLEREHVDALRAEQAALEQLSAVRGHLAAVTERVARAARDVTDSTEACTSAITQEQEAIAAWSRAADAAGLDDSSSAEVLEHELSAIGQVRGWIDRLERGLLTLASLAKGATSDAATATEASEALQAALAELKLATGTLSTASARFEVCLEALRLTAETYSALPSRGLPDSRVIDAESDLDALLRTLRNAASGAAARFDGANIRAMTARGHLKDLDTARQTLTPELEAAEAAENEARRQLEQELAARALAMPEDLDGIRLPADDLAAARNELAGLECELQNADSSLKHATEEATVHAERRPNPFHPPWLDEPLSRETLPGQIETLGRRREELADELASVRGALQSADEASTRRTELSHALQEASRQAEPWLQLHDLIGIRGGERFREFAQALNLGQVLANANRHLERLKDRYELVPVRDEQSGLPTLDFEVEDRWRPGTRRSLKTLSGGESFLVSLALALGLSDLRTTTMPIETLLLDEGFGTLDGETLELALAVLQQLQASGRQVGIISHVGQLQERIPARILVEPLGAGRSSLRVTSA